VLATAIAERQCRDWLGGVTGDIEEAIIFVPAVGDDAALAKQYDLGRKQPRYKLDNTAKPSLPVLTFETKRTRVAKQALNHTPAPFQRWPPLASLAPPPSYLTLGKPLSSDGSDADLDAIPDKVAQFPSLLTIFIHSHVSA
jgi:hypothetical protein